MSQELKIYRVVALPPVKEAGALYLLKNVTSGNVEIHAVSSDGQNVYSNLTKEQMVAYLSTFVATSASRLQNTVSIAASGDATWTVNFNGSANVSSAITFTATGDTAGTYNNIAVDAKGRVTSLRNLLPADIPALPGSKINSDLTVNTTGNAATATLATKALALSAPVKINGVNFDGSEAITINAVDSTARIAQSEKGAAGGVAPLDSNGLVPAANLPSFVDDVVEVDSFDKLPGRPSDPLTNGPASKGKIYIVVTGEPGAEVTEIYRWSGSAYIEILSGVGVSDAATKLATSRSISITGDATWTVNFDGSSNVSAVMTLADSGVTAGTYGNLTVDSKGRLTEARLMTEADMPTLTYNKVASSASISVADPQW